MAGYPDRCPSCKEPNAANLHYCAVCGVRFRRQAPSMPTEGANKKAISKEQKLKLKKLQKKKELVELYKKKKITSEQFAKGMAKLGYSTDVEKAMAFKKYIRDQIRAFEAMDVSGAEEGGVHFDPNESNAQLHRDEFGNVITDFSVSPTPAAPHHAPHEINAHPKMVSSRATPISNSPGGPMFGDSLFTISGPSKPRAPRKDIPKGKLKRDVPSGPSKRSGHRRRGADLEWDDEEDEFVQEEETEEEEDFVIDLDDGGESGWWDDEEWELDWNDEDEEDWEDWEVDVEEEEEDEWEMWEDEIEQPSGVTVEFEDDDDEEDVFDPRTYYADEEDEDDEWDKPRRKRRR